MLQQPALALEAAAIAGERAVGADHAVAGITMPGSALARPTAAPPPAGDPVRERCTPGRAGGMAQRRPESAGTRPPASTGNASASSRPPVGCRRSRTQGIDRHGSIVPKPLSCQIRSRARRNRPRPAPPRCATSTIGPAGRSTRSTSEPHGSEPLPAALLSPAPEYRVDHLHVGEAVLERHRLRRAVLDRLRRTRRP